MWHRGGNGLKRISLAIHKSYLQFFHLFFINQLFYSNNVCNLSAVLSYIQKCIIDMQQCSAMNKQSCITFQQCFVTKQTYFGLNKLNMLSTNVFWNSPMSLIQYEQS